MRKRKAPVYSQNHPRFAYDVFLQGKTLYEEGKASITYFDPLSYEVHGNVDEDGKRFAIGMSFSLDGALSGASCSCKGNSSHPCRHMAAVLLKLEEQVGEKAEASLPDFLFYVKSQAPLCLSKGPMSYLKKCVKELKKRKEKWNFDSNSVYEGFKAILSSSPSYSGFGGEEEGEAIPSFLSELGMGVDMVSMAMSEFPSLLSVDARKGLYIGLLSSEDWKELATERFEAGLTNGVSYDVLRLYLGQEESLLCLLNSYSLHLLCRADFRFKGFESLAKMLLERGDAQGLSLLCDNAHCDLSFASWSQIGTFLEKEGDVEDALCCYKKMFGKGEGDLPALCEYWRGLSEEEKALKKEDFTASLKGSGLLAPFLFLLGEGKDEDIASFRLGDFPALKKELEGHPYENYLIAKMNKALKEKEGAHEAIWSCFRDFPCLESTLLGKEAEELSLTSPYDRSIYLYLLTKKKLLDRKGLSLWEGK